MELIADPLDGKVRKEGHGYHAEGGFGAEKKATAAAS